MQGTTRFPSVKERRQRYRQEMIDAILSTAREVMQEQGVAALNLNEIARRLGVTGQALAKYFPNKAALYDTLFLIGHRLFREAEEEFWRTTRPDWNSIPKWFELRLNLAREHPDLYYLIWERGMPGFVPSEPSQEEIHKMLTVIRSGISSFIKTEGINAGMSSEQVVDILIAARHGVISEIMGKTDLVPREADRFRKLIPNIVAVFQQAWTPKDETSRTG